MERSAWSERFYPAVGPHLQPCELWGCCGGAVVCCVWRVRFRMLNRGPGDPGLRLGEAPGVLQAEKRLHPRLFRTEDGVASVVGVERCADEPRPPLARARSNRGIQGARQDSRGGRLALSRIQRPRGFDDPCPRGRKSSIRGPRSLASVAATISRSKPARRSISLAHAQSRAGRPRAPPRRGPGRSRGRETASPEAIQNRTRRRHRRRREGLRGPTPASARQGSLQPGDSGGSSSVPGILNDADGHPGGSRVCADPQPRPRIRAARAQLWQSLRPSPSCPLRASNRPRSAPRKSPAPSASSSSAPMSSPWQIRGSA